MKPRGVQCQWRPGCQQHADVIVALDNGQLVPTCEVDVRALHLDASVIGKLAGVNLQRLAEVPS